MKSCLVVGCATSVWADVAKARELGPWDSVYCIKLAGVHWPAKFDVWAGLHPEFMEYYKKERAVLGFPDGYEVVCPPPEEVGRHAHHPADRRVSYRWPGMVSSASSGIYGAKVALDDGHDRVALAGVPMVKEDAHFTRGGPWAQIGAFIPGLEKSVPFMKGKVKSFSGLTRELLGEPTRDWLEGFST